MDLPTYNLIENYEPLTKQAQETLTLVPLEWELRIIKLILEYAGITFNNHWKPFSICIVTVVFILGADDWKKVILTIGYCGGGLYI